MNIEWNKSFAKKSEGTVKNGSKHIMYKCPAGKLTIGYGYNIEDNGIDEATAEYLLNKSLINTVALLEYNIMCFDDIDDVRQSVLIDMCFNLGWPKFSSFKKMLAAIDAGDYLQAAEEMEDSKWFGQVGDRSMALKEMMISGVYPD